MKAPKQKNLQIMILLISLIYLPKNLYSLIQLVDIFEHAQNSSGEQTLSFLIKLDLDMEVNIESPIFEIQFPFLVDQISAFYYTVQNKRILQTESNFSYVRFLNLKRFWIQIIKRFPHLLKGILNPIRHSFSH